MIYLNSEGTEVDIGGSVIKVNQNIDFKPDTEDKVTVGKVTAFKRVFADPFNNNSPHSVWMYVTEIENSKNKLWLSIEVWLQHYQNGLFSNFKPEKLLIDVSKEPEDDELMF